SDRRTLVAGERSLVHAHGLPPGGADVRVHVRPNPGASPVRLRASVEGREVVAGLLPPDGLSLAFDAPADRGGGDILLDADSPAPSAGPRLMIDAVTVSFRSPARLRWARAIPVLVGAIVCALAWARGRRATALGWSILLAALTAALLAAVLAPVARLRFDPG